MSILNWTSDYSFGTGGFGSYSGVSSKVTSQSKLNRISRDFATGHTDDLKNIKTYIENNEYDKAVSIFNELKSEASTLDEYYNVELSDSQCKSIVSNALERQTGLNLSDTISVNSGSDPFATGFAEGIPLIGWLFNGVTEDEALSEFNGTKVGKSRTYEGVGAGFGGAVGGAVAGAIAAGFVAGSAVPGIGNLIGAGIGALIGIGCGLAQWATKNAYKS